MLSAEGYRPIWCRSTRRAELDASARHQQLEGREVRRFEPFPLTARNPGPGRL
jgi:hypothetical protein